jgi:polar amino acid transport system substrate-binding protein
MTKLITVFTLIVMLATPALAQNESAYERVMRTGTLRCGYAVSPPVLVKDPNTGAISGMNVDIWNMIGRDLKLKIEWVESGSWGTVPEDLRQGKFDAFCSQVWMNAARTKFLTTTMPVAYTFVYAYVRPDDTRFTDVSAFNSPSVTIPAVDGDITEEMATSRFPSAKLYSLPSISSFSDLYLAVTAKKADVLFIDPASFVAVSKANPVKLKKLSGQPVFTFGGRFSFAVGELVLRDMIDVELQKMVDDGSLARIAKASSPFLIAPDKNYTYDAK